MGGKYDDIIDLPHHQSDRHPHMSLHDRAAQFSPFAALTGHGAAIQEAGRLTESFREPDENQKAILDGKLQILLENPESRPMVRIWHFLPDEKKEGGAYVETEGKFRGIDGVRREIVLESGERIAISGIREIQSEIFSETEIGR